MSDMEGSWTIKRLLEWTASFFARKNVDPPRLSAELLLSHVLGAARIKLYTDFDRIPTDAQLTTFRELVKRAAEQEPIAYLTGKAHFFNLEFQVTRDVLIPRPDTETLVEHALQLSRRTSGFETPRVLDLCTGSGCIAAAIAHHQKHAVVVATEISPAAVAIAAQNLQRLGLQERVTLLQGDLFQPLATLVDRNPYDILVSNPPYIATGKIAELDRSVRDYEPTGALDGGADGLDFHRRILSEAPAFLRNGARVFLEIAFDQGDAAKEIGAASPDFEQISVFKDHGGNDRILAAVRK